MKIFRLYFLCLFFLTLIMFSSIEAKNNQPLQGGGSVGPSLSAEALRNLMKTPDNSNRLIRETRVINQTGIFWDYCQGVLRYPDGTTYCYLQQNEQWIWTSVASLGNLLLACAQSQNLCGFNVTAVFTDGSFLWDVAIISGQ